MASKGKSKLKHHEIKFGSKCLDAKRFAYDVMVHSALRFKVPKNCISIWEGSENDYGCPEFCLVLSRLILRNQIVQRFVLHKLFNNRYESKNLESFKSVGDLLQEVIGRMTGKIQIKGFRLYIIDEVETSLSIACELILFLYSKNSNLYLKELAGYWFDCYFHLEKQKFEKAGGLDSLYKRGKGELADAFYDTFISVHCLPYEASAQDEHLKELFYQSSDAYKKKITGRHSAKESEQKKEVVGHDSPSMGYTEEQLINFSLPFLTSELIEASGINLPVNTGHGIMPLEELLRGVGASETDATQSQNLPGASRQEPARYRRGSSGQQRRPRDKSSLRSSVEQSLGRLRLGEDSGIDLPVNTGLGIVPHEVMLRGDGDSDADATPSQNLPGGSPQKGARHRRRSSGQQRRRRGKSNLCSSGEQGMGQLRLDSSGTKQSSEKKPSVSVADDPTSSHNLPLAGPQEPARHRRESSGQQKKPNGKSNVRSSVEQGLGLLRLGEASGIDLPVNTGLGIIPHEALLRDADETPSQSLPDQTSPQEEPDIQKKIWSEEQVAISGQAGRMNC
ncbi:hypothetical protein AVEN_180613-1 [Araneus ventricosus]|uniref:Uncharacterized protein n=1 Tax=Araneus ventricosus TaxID=182803 RepID=A0A4Y2W076_ARAVE|nr:hypothetical protein AVEN_180613-1 [Araneus ventricosus]